MVAIAVLALFYLAALAAVGGLGYLGARGLAVGGGAGRFHPLVLLAAGASLIAAAVIAWSVLPRRDRFVAPGPEVTAAEQPALFATLRALAAATGVAMPVHVYLVDDVTAFVGERGGVLGLGARPVMALGMPLLRVLTSGARGGGAYICGAIGAVARGSPVSIEPQCRHLIAAS